MGVCVCVCVFIWFKCCVEQSIGCVSLHVLATTFEWNDCDLDVYVACQFTVILSKSYVQCLQCGLTKRCR